MEDILHGLILPEDPALLVGIHTRDDAGIYMLREDLALIQTLDFFTPMVDDPYIFGQIAAANAINDVYAMGGQPLTAMNVVCFPQCEDMGVLRDILAGGLSKIKEAGALLVGGHTVDDNEPKYGLAVSGLVHPQNIISNSQARPGDNIYLTKPIGNGVVATAVKAEMAVPEHLDEAVKWMTTLNKAGAEVMQSSGIKSATDVTGFGLLGHLFEIATASDVQVEVYAEKVPLLAGVREYAGYGLIPAGAYSNREYLQDKVRYEQELDENLRDLLFCPETAGGLLIAVPEDQEEVFLKNMALKGSPAHQIGKVVAEKFAPMRIMR
ncbi:Selenide, water dikinase, class I [Syntrophomonas zehnderi OL-4]|uniref:Selenide, water dikinase n=1 Tax=Syntrophomonas zehnderi OL-4 TaxID=690567 RepID=A0A0E4GC01_9FIRM|nr:Selenide, water dikinase, class I [Syntrophomonas zehnderi OL-4]